MLEFGSDFHFIELESQSIEKSLSSYYPSANFYADGRQALIHLYQTQGWERLWVPSYYCYDVIETLEAAGLFLCFYTDCPSVSEDCKALGDIQRQGLFRKNDAFLRVNYYGMRSCRSCNHLPIPVVEDHTHDLIGGWALHSTADWCIASLRKTLPIPEGGILWSPRGLPLPDSPICMAENEKVAETRWEAMELKARYLAGDDIDKSAFRSGFLDTEEFFDRAPICSIDRRSAEFLRYLDVQDWYIRKRENWNVLRNIRKDCVRVILPDNLGCYPFSLILLFDTFKERDRVRKALIANQIYPAILWSIPPTLEGEVFKFSRTMLSIHCDARYTTADILQMKSIIESIL